jgi:hypothetical protein
MRWSRQNLPTEAVVALPPVYVHPLIMFRVIAHRAVFVTQKDGGEATFDAGFAAKWLARMDLIAGPMPRIAHDSWTDLVAGPLPPEIDEDTRVSWNKYRVRPLLSAYRDLAAERLMALFREEHVTHAICERGTICERAFSVLYADTAYVAVQLEDR